MVERSYSNSELVEIIRNALALALRRDGLENGTDRMLAEGFDLDTAFAALRLHLHAQSFPPVAGLPGERDPQRREHSQSVAKRVAHEKAEALTTLRAALAPAGPFITIPKLRKAFHIRFRSVDRIENGFSYRRHIIEIVTDKGILPGSNVIMLSRPTRDPDDQPTVQELIDELDREACATLATERKPLKKEARAALIQPKLAAKGYNLAQGTIENRLKAKRS